MAGNKEIGLGQADGRPRVSGYTLERSERVPVTLQESHPFVALVGPEVEENLSLRYLAASLAAHGCRAEIYPFNASGDLPRVLAALLAPPRPFLIALSLSFQWRAEDVLALAVALRRSGYQGHVTAGGHFASFAYADVMRDFPEVDSVCRFEAEDTLGELCAAVFEDRNQGDVAGLVLRSPTGGIALTAPRRPPRLEALPWPDRRGPRASCLGHAIAPMIGSRGCYAHCAFCCIATLHRTSSPHERHRLRDVEDIADEMAHLQREDGVDIFIFHDDNFFLPSHERTMQRLQALASALDARRLGRFATVVKARPNDVTIPIFRFMRERIGLVRLFLGVESSTTQGCETLGRGVTARAGASALRLLEELGLYVCFNMLVFDPDASPEALLENMEFIEANGEHPSNFGRVELYAGTPLLERLQREHRAFGDYLGWSYDQATPEMQRVFELTMTAFEERNFSGHALANRLQGTRFDVEVARHFHPNLFQSAWLVRAKALSRRLATSSAAGVRRIVEHVRAHPDGREHDETFVRDLASELRACEASVQAVASALEDEVTRAVGAACCHAPRKGIPVGRRDAAASRFLETVDGCGVAQ